MEISRRKARYREILPRIDAAGRDTIVTDDGVATGATFQAALWTVRSEKPARLIAALPVAPEEAILNLAADADEIICLRCPALFSAVGQFYLNFTQTSDDEVIQILEEEMQRKQGKQKTERTGQ
jgi:predicted phosphoribosyltransferase